MPWYIFKTENQQNLANTTLAQLTDIFAPPAGCPPRDLKNYFPRISPGFYLKYSSDRGIYHINLEAFNITHEV
jgi:hypothetical protein